MAIDQQAFIIERLTEFDNTIETRVGTPYNDLFIKPLSYILQPYSDQLAATQTNQSLSLILALPEPDEYSTVIVDDFGSNLFVDRNLGGNAQVIVQVFYSQPVTRNFPPGTAQILSNTGLSFYNTVPVSITAADMSLNVLGALYYLEFTVQAAATGAAYNVAEGDLVTLVGDPDVVSVNNPAGAFALGSNTETNTQYITRIQGSIGARDLNTGNGINGLLYQNFPQIQSIQAIGFEDPEMQRDIIYNAHIGGFVDIYLKLPTFTTEQQNFVALSFDTTRNIQTSTVMQIPNTSLTDPLGYLGNPNIVFGTLTVSGTQPAAAAFINSVTIPITGINLISQNAYIKLQIDAMEPINIKVAGAIPTSTGINEIVDSINAAIGFNVATLISSTKFRLTSLTVGQGSQIILSTPDLPRGDATDIVFGSPSPITITGFVPIMPIEGVDYEVDYSGGYIAQLPSHDATSIISGRVIYGPFGDGTSTIGTRQIARTNGGLNAAQVSIGDTVVVTGGTGVVPGTYFIANIIGDTTIVLDPSFPNASVSASNIAFYIVSNKTYVISYQFNPLSIDIGNMVKLNALGTQRGIRPGRENFTITNMAFIELLSIQQIDPDTLEGLGTYIYNPSTGIGASGYGGGGYGDGPYGIGGGALFYMQVNSINERFSAFEDSVLIFNPSLFGNSYQVSYTAQLDIPNINTFCRSDENRVVSDDVLPKNFIPCFIDFTLDYAVNPANAATQPTTAQLESMLETYVQDSLPNTSMESSQLVALISQYTTYIKLPLALTGRVIKANGSVEVLTSNDAITVPDVITMSQTNDPTTARIVTFYPGNITLNLLAAAPS